MAGNGFSGERKSLIGNWELFENDPIVMGQDASGDVRIDSCPNFCNGYVTA